MKLRKQVLSHAFDHSTSVTCAKTAQSQTLNRKKSVWPVNCDTWHGFEPFKFDINSVRLFKGSHHAV